MSCFLKDNPSYEHYLSCLEEFTAVSGLKVNKEKTEFFSLGLKKREYFPCNFMTSVKILGVHWSYNCSLKKKENFEGILKSVKKKKTLNMWKWRGLTLLGKIQIVKSFAIQKFISKASIINVSKDLIVLRLCADFGQNCALYDKSTKLGGNKQHNPGINFRYGASAKIRSDTN